MALVMIFSLFGVMPKSSLIAEATQSRKDNFSKNYILTGNGAQDILNVAFAQVGKKGSEFGYTESWCANFVSDCADLAGQSAAIPRNGAVSHEYTSSEPWYGLKQTVLNAGGYVVSSPQPGDLVIWKNSISHVEIVSKVSNGVVYSIGGNNGGTGNPKTNYVAGERKVSSIGSVTCYVRPKYIGGTPTPDLVTPTISTDKSSYNIGDTVNLSWAASPAGSNLSHYWLNLIAPDGTYVYGGTMNKNTSYSFTVSQSGDYSITTYATPIGSKDGEGSLTDTKIINVLNPDDIGHIMSESEGAGQTIPDGDYWIYNGLNMYYFLDIPGTEKITETGANIQMWCDSENIPTENDVWTITYCNNGFYKIRQRGTNMCLDVSDASIYRGSNVQLCNENSSYAQQWSITRTQHGYTLQSRCNAFYLDVYNAEVSSGTNVQVWTGNDEKCQSFSFIPCDSNERPIEDGVYDIQTACNSNYYLDVSGGRGEYKNDTNVQIWEEATDQYRVEYVGNGWYKIYEESSGLAVEVNNGDEQRCFMDNQRNVQLYENNTGRGQLWRIRETSDGHYFLISKLSGCYLDLLDGKCSIGQNVSQVYYLGGNPQKWNFIKVDTEGDINRDNHVTVSDSVILQKYILGIQTLTQEQAKFADLTQDGIVNIFDLSILKHKLFT